MYDLEDGNGIQIGISIAWDILWFYFPTGHHYVRERSWILWRAVHVSNQCVVLIVLESCGVFCQHRDDFFARRCCHVNSYLTCARVDCCERYCLANLFSILKRIGSRFPQCLYLFGCKSREGHIFQHTWHIVDINVQGRRSLQRVCSIKACLVI